MLVQRLLVPGLVFQGVVIGGGYSTGRELVEFFLSYGPIGALLGLATVALVWSATMAIAFNYAVLTRSYEYSTFLRGLLGPLRYPAEAVFFALALLSLAVITDAAETIFQQRLSAWAGAGLVVVALGAFLGLAIPRHWLERAMAFWSILLYAAFTAIFVLVFANQGAAIGDVAAAGEVKPGWATIAVLYASLNLAVIPTVLFTLQGLNSVSEARAAGALAGVIGVAPALLFVVAMFAFHPAILEAPVPLTMVLSGLRVGAWGVLFDIAVLGALLQTVLGTLNALNDRLAVEMQRRDIAFSGAARGVVGLAVLAVAVAIGAQFGIVAIIANAYAVVTVLMFLLLVLPIQTIGLWRCVKGA